VYTGILNEKNELGAFNLPLFFYINFAFQNNSAAFQLLSEVLVSFEEPISSYFR